MRVEQIHSSLRDNWKLGLPFRKIVHVGANTGQEVVYYDNLNIEGFHLEAHPEYFADLQKNCMEAKRQTAVLACCDAEEGQVIEFNVTSNKQSSSFFPLGRHAVAHPSVKIVEKIRLSTTTLDTLVSSGQLPSDPNVVVLDVQGGEGRVLRGAETFLQAPSLWGVYSEVSLDSLYEGGVSFDALYTEILKPAGFFFFHASINRQGWGNAWFLRRWWRLEGESEAPLEYLSRTGGQA